MKKILTVSIMAVMAVTAANAEIASKAYVDTQTGQLSTLTTTAKTNLVGAINELAAKAGNTSVADQIAAALTPYSTTEQSNAAYATAAQGQTAEDTAATVATYGDIVTHNAADFATAAQGTKADSALQQSDVAQTYSATGTAPVSGAAVASAISTAGGNYATAAQGQTAEDTAATVATYGDIVTHNAADFATAAQGTKADSAVQTVTSTGDGNVVTGVSANTNGTVTVTSAITAIPQPSGRCTDCVLHYNGTAYSWEEITR